MRRSDDPYKQGEMEGVADGSLWAVGPVVGASVAYGNEANDISLATGLPVERILEIMRTEAVYCASEDGAKDYFMRQCQKESSTGK